MQICQENGRVRSKTVEPVIGTLVNFTNMKRQYTRHQNANKHVLMASLTVQLEEILRLYHQKTEYFSLSSILKQGKNFAFCKSVFPSHQ